MNVPGVVSRVEDALSNLRPRKIDDIIAMHQRLRIALGPDLRYIIKPVTIEQKLRRAAMYVDSRQTIHIGINFLFLPIAVVNKHSHLRFLECLNQQAVDFTTTSITQQEIVVIRESPSRLETRIAVPGQPPIGQLVIVAPYHDCDVNLFTREAEAVVQAFESTWPEGRRQIIKTDVTLRDLYETSAEHAFQELWEIRLHQSPDSLAVLGRPVLGGGLRFVMPQQPGDSEPVQIEVKMESFLRNTKKLFVETVFVWPAPRQPGAPFDLSNRLKAVDDYVEQQVTAFLAEGCQ